MLQIFCPFCEHVIRANDTDQEVVCKNCGRRFPIESGDACYFKHKDSSSPSIKKSRKGTGAVL